MKRKPTKTQEDLAEVYQKGLKNLSELWNTKLRFTPEELKNKETQNQTY